VEVTVCADELTHYRDFIAFASGDGHPSAGQIRPRGLIVPVYHHGQRNGRSECQGTDGDVTVAQIMTGMGCGASAVAARTAHRESSGDYGAGDMGDCRHRAVANGCAQDSLRSRTAARY
jgi:hypothetical protein